MNLSRVQKFNLKKAGKYILMGATALGAVALHRDICFKDGQVDGASKMRCVATEVYPDFTEKVSAHLDMEDAEEEEDNE